MKMHAVIQKIDADPAFCWEKSARDQLGYLVTNNWDANNCEYYIDGSLGTHRNTSEHMGTNDLTFYFHIDRKTLVEEQGGQILNLGAYLYPAGLVTAEGDEIKLQSFAEQYAFFLDVKRSDGCIDRLWLKNGIHNFMRKDIFDYAISGNSWSHGGMVSFYCQQYYVGEDSPLFNQKKACKCNCL